MALACIHLNHKRLPETCDQLPLALSAVRGHEGIGPRLDLLLLGLIVEEDEVLARDWLPSRGMDLGVGVSVTLVAIATEEAIEAAELVGTGSIGVIGVGVGG